MYNDFLNKNFNQISENFIQIKTLSPIISECAGICTEALKKGNKIMFCGNGGSAADSQHLAAELIGRYKVIRNSISAIALTTDTSILTAIGNDFEYEQIFARQVEGLGKSGDVLIGLSTSGESKNVLSAFEKAKSIGINTIAFTGITGGKMNEVADFVINVPSKITNNIQEMHIAVGHLMCEIIENELTTKALFLDRDGVVNVDKGYVHKEKDFEFIDGIFNLCQKAQDKGYKIIVITNQSGIERGYFKTDDFDKINNYMLSEFKKQGIAITDVLYCPSLEGNDRKPNSGMFEKAQKKYNINMGKSISVGDKKRDIDAAVKSGVFNNYLFLADDVHVNAVTIENLEEIKFN